ncbi:MAG: GNAT family N-acetyltransferase [Lachnospiraceae bacterium]|nr:GNAT family N-acetyltransferase [Lachnospiraceae bacterium]MBR5067150.1 GNAT family N-acetyltransferase [Lachnospiraceae bacterium]
MILEEERHILNGREVVFRSPKIEEADMLIKYLKTVTGETRFLMCESDEVQFTTESEIEFLKEHNDSPKGLLMLAFVDGEHAGNCSFLQVSGTRRSAHRASLGIALYQKYTGFGLGRMMMERMLEIIKELGFEQAELIVIGGNDRAYHLYESLGFKETGRNPNANKYDDGTYADDIHMVKILK